MAEIAVDFLLGPDISSRLIAWFGNGGGDRGYSHCASVLSDSRYLDARSDVLAGVPGGIHIRLPETEAWIRKRRCTLEVTQAEYAEWEGSLRSKISDAYAVPDIVGFVVNRMLHRPGTYDCSALVINALQHIKKVPFPLPFPAHSLTPNDALLIVATAGFTVGDVQLQPKVGPNAH
jgi:hypothetical protein